MRFIVLKYDDFYFSAFWLEIAYSYPFWGILEAHFPQNMATHRSNPQKDHPCAETRRLSHKACAQRLEKKGKDSQKSKSQSGNILHVWGEAPTVPIETKICMLGHRADIITYAAFQDDIFRGYDVRGVECPIFLLIFAWALQQCSATALPVIFAFSGRYLLLYLLRFGIRKPEKNCHLFQLET